MTAMSPIPFEIHCIRGRAGVRAASLGWCLCERRRRLLMRGGAWWPACVVERLSTAGGGRFRGGGGGFHGGGARGGGFSGGGFRGGGFHGGGMRMGGLSRRRHAFRRTTPLRWWPRVCRQISFRPAFVGARSFGVPFIFGPFIFRIVRLRTVRLCGRASTAPVHSACDHSRDATPLASTAALGAPLRWAQPRESAAQRSRRAIAT